MSKDPSLPGTTVPAVKTETDASASDRMLHKDAVDRPDKLSSASFPHVIQTKEGRARVQTTIPNTRHLLNGYGISVEFDVIRKREQIIIPGLKTATEMADTTALAHIISLANLNGLQPNLIPEFVSAIASENQTNPPLDWILGKAWDGTDRLASFLDTVTIHPNYDVEFARTLIHRWLRSAVAALMSIPGYKTRGVLVLQGPQGLGKTSWIMNLVGDPFIRDRYVKTGHHLDPGNKDSIISAVSHWIVELGELDSTFKKDIARLKGTLTDSFDKVRLPYARRESEFPRRTVFCASVNEDTYLVDTTGNTRFWTVPVTALNYNHDIDTQQLFAQIMTEVQDKQRWWLTQEEDTRLETLNADYRAVNVIRDLIYAAYDPELPRATWGRYSAIDLLHAIGIEKPTNAQCKDAASTLRELQHTIGEPTRSQGKTRWLFPLAGATKMQSWQTS